MKYAVVFFLLLSSCAKRIITFNPQMEAKYVEYAESYVVDASRYGIGVDTHNLIIKTDQMAGAVLGYCEYSTRTDYIDFREVEKTVKVIRINSLYWDKMNRIARYTLIYHELDHCLRKSHHDDNALLFNNWKVSKIMSTYSSLLYSSYLGILYATYWDGLVENMFTGKDQRYLTHDEYLQNSTAKRSSIWEKDTIETLTKF